MVILIKATLISDPKWSAEIGDPFHLLEGENEGQNPR